MAAKSFGKYKKYNRFNVIGTSGTGKTTFSKRLAAVLSLPYIEMDQIFWKPNWQESTNETFFEKLKYHVNKKSWVLDGNYSRTTEIKWSGVECVIWLDYALPVTFYRMVTRTIKRSLSQEELWLGTGNKESFRKSFMSKDSIILWTLQTYHKNKKRYTQIMKSSLSERIDFLRLISPKEANQFLIDLKT